MYCISLYLKWRLIQPPDTVDTCRGYVLYMQAGARASNEEEVGKVHHVLVEALSKKSDAEWADSRETAVR